MNKLYIIVLILMLLAHFFADFHLQAILADMKQEQWWRKQEGYNSKCKCKYDYLAALAIHSAEWTLWVMMPPLMLLPHIDLGIFLLMAALNMVVHSLTDNSKANYKDINLIQDQIIHLAQIAFTYAAMVVV